MKYEIEIIQLETITKIVNKSKRKLILSNIPVHPQRKSRDKLLILPESFIILDFPFDIEKHYIRFEK